MRARPHRQLAWMSIVFILVGCNANSEPGAIPLDPGEGASGRVPVGTGGGSESGGTDSGVSGGGGGGAASGGAASGGAASGGVASGGAAGGGVAGAGAASGGVGGGSDLAVPPDGYTVVDYRDYETTQTVGQYLGSAAWYFWDGGKAQDNTGTEFDRRFTLAPDPAAFGNRVLRITKFDGDKDYTGTGLNPRAELSFRPSLERPADRELYFRIRTYLEGSQATIFSAEFVQFWLHGSSNIPLQLEVNDGRFKVRRPDKGRVDVRGDAKLSSHVDRWITWEARARFSQTAAYWRVYMDGQLVFDQAQDTSWPTSDWPGAGGTWHLQYGAYANNGGAGTMVIYFDDAMVGEK